MLLTVAEVLADGPSIFEVLLLKEAIDHGHGACHRSVLLVERPAFYDLCADRVKISRAHAHPPDIVALGSRWWRRFSLDEYFRAPSSISLHGAVKRKTYLLDAWNRTQARVELPV